MADLPTPIPTNSQKSGGGTSHLDFLNDSNITITRSPTSTISNSKQLAATERYELRFHLRQWVKVVDKEGVDASDLVITEAHRQRFFDAVFDSWSSSYGKMEVPTSPTRKRKEDSRLHVSVWSDDLPESPKRKIDNEDGSPNKRKRVGRTITRKKGEPAFLAINKIISQEESKVAFEYKDAIGQVASANFVDWENSMTKRRLKAKAVVQYDTAEQKRTRLFNEELIVKTVRNYIVDAADAGISNTYDVELEAPVVRLPRTL
ncbi:hypothetical protein ACHAPO_002470 [Fusarium lateritium]